MQAVYRDCFSRVFPLLSAQNSCEVKKYEQRHPSGLPRCFCSGSSFGLFCTRRPHPAVAAHSSGGDPVGRGSTPRLAASRRCRSCLRWGCARGPRAPGVINHHPEGAKVHSWQGAAERPVRYTQPSEPVPCRDGRNFLCLGKYNGPFCKTRAAGDPALWFCRDITIKS